MEDRHRQLDVAKVSRAFLHVFTASCALEGSIDGAELRVVEPLLAWTLSLLILQAV